MSEIKTYRGAYNPEEERYYKLSRSKIESYISCKRCFYLDRKLKVAQPPGFPFNLNSAVDQLLKNEFDEHRENETTHPYIKQLGLNAVPFKHEMMVPWRENFKGVEYAVDDLKFLIHGAVDDIWVDKDSGELIVVDYKSTSKNDDITLDAEWQGSYKRQMEIYQYLLRKNGFKVSNTGYFVYCNGIKTGNFNEKLKFKMYLIDYTGDDSWIDGTLKEIHSLLNKGKIPSHSEDCDFCQYQTKLNALEEQVSIEEPENLNFCALCGEQKLVNIDGRCVDCGGQLIKIN